VVKLKHETDVGVAEFRQFIALQFIKPLAFQDNLPLVGLVEGTQDVEEGAFSGP